MLVAQLVVNRGRKIRYRANRKQLVYRESCDKPNNKSIDGATLSILCFFIESEKVGESKSIGLVLYSLHSSCPQSSV